MKPKKQSPKLEAIFKKAMVSMNPDAILEVAGAFGDLGEEDIAQALYTRVSLLEAPSRVMPTFGTQGNGRRTTFGAMQRGTPIPNTNGAVIPPGRYWIDVVGDAKRKAWVDWSTSKPEVVIEKSEYSADNLNDPNQVMATIIFSIPPTANNFGHPGVFFPTQVLGFPTIAGAADDPYAVHSKSDTVQRGNPMTYAEAAKEVVAKAPRAVQRSVQYVAETAGKALGDAARGAKDELGLSKTNMVLIGAGVLAALFLIGRIMSPVSIVPHVLPQAAKL
jgi:hypothetical protein